MAKNMKSSRMPQLRCSGKQFIAYPLLPFQQIGICVTKCWMKAYSSGGGSCDYETRIPAFTKIKYVNL